MSAAAATVLQSILWAVNGVFGGLVQTLAGPAGDLLQTSLTQPYPLGAGAEAVWAFMRDLALAGLTALLAYGALRHMLGAALGLPAASPGQLIGRAVVAAAGTACSLSVVNWLLSANGTLVRALIASATAHGGPLSGLLGSVAFLAGGSATAAAVGLVAPEVLALACLAAGLWVAAAYYVRAAEILLLGAVAPVAAALWMLPEASGVWASVLAEVVVAVFTQAGQLLVLWLAAAAGMGGAGGALGNLLLTLALLVMLARVRTLLQAVVRGGRPQGPWGTLASWRVVRDVSAGAMGAAARLVRGALQ
jgi:hypothetical protein